MEEFAGFRLIMGVNGTWMFVPGAFICALVYWIRFCHAPGSMAKSAVKTASVLLLAVAAWVPWAPAGLVLALCLCALGDFLLSRPGERAFMAGVGAFAAGHLAYVYVFLTHRLARPEALFDGVHLWVIAVLLAIGVVMAVVLWRRAGALRWAVLAYIPVILSMAVAVLVLPGIGALNFAFFAAALFLISDLVLAFETFVWRTGSAAARVAPFVVWPTYWLAQFGFYLAFAGVPLK